MPCTRERKLGSVALLLLAAALLPALSSAANVTVSVAYTSSVRGDYLDDGSGCNATTPANPECDISAARTVDYLQSFRAASAHPLVLEGGSYFFGSLFYFTYGTAAARYFHDAAGYDVAVLGTGDFFGGSSDLASFLGGIGAQAVATNLGVVDSGTALSPLVARYAVVNTNNISVGVVSNVKDRLLEITTFGDDEGVEASVNALDGGEEVTAKQAVLVAVAEMREAHPDVKTVVLVYRQNDATLSGEEEAYRFARDIQGVGAVVVFPESGERDAARAPSVRENLFGERFVISSQPLGPKYAASFEVVIDDATGEVQGAGGASDVVKFTSDVAEDAAALAQLAEFAEGVANFTSEEIATVVEPQAGDEDTCRFRSCGAGRVITDAMLAKCGARCDAALLNGGGIGNGLAVGPVTRADVLTMLQFPDFLQVVTMSGTDLVEVLRHSVTWGSPSGKYLQFAGLQVAHSPASDTDRPVVNRLLEISVAREGVLGHPSSADDFAPLDVTGDTNYTLVLPSFIAGGGDGYDALADRTTVVDERLVPDLQQIVVEYLSGGPALPPETDGCASPPLNAVPVAAGAVACRTVENDAVEGVNVLLVCGSNLEVCESGARETLFALPPAGTEDCRQCSGLGQCDNVECVCLVPSAGPFAGIPMARGEECDDVRERKDFWFFGLVLVGGLTLVSFAVLLASFAFVHTYRKHATIRSGSPLFIQLVNVGGLLVLASVVAMLQDPGRLTCGLYAWLFATGVSLTVGALMLKTMRVHRLFRTKEIARKLRLSNSHLLGYLAGLLAVTWALLLALQLASPLDEKVVPNDADWDYELACGSDSGIWFVGALIAYNAGLLASAIYYAYAIRDVDTNFNESRFLVAALQNMLVVSGIAIVAFFVTYHGQITGRTLLLAMVMNVLVLSTHGILLASKMYALRKHTFEFGRTPSASVTGDDDDDDDGGGGGDDGIEMGGRGSEPSTASRSRVSRTSARRVNPRVAERLVSRNRELEEENIALRSKIMRAETRASMSQQERPDAAVRAASAGLPASVAEEGSAIEETGGEDGGKPRAATLGASSSADGGFV